MEGSFPTHALCYDCHLSIRSDASGRANGAHFRDGEEGDSSCKIPGAVILIGNQGKIVYRRAFGLRALKPKKLPMTTDTIFDIASLTKVIATSTAVAQLVEMGKLDLEDPVGKYWPEFKANGKEGSRARPPHALFRP